MIIDGLKMHLILQSKLLLRNMIEFFMLLSYYYFRDYDDDSEKVD